MPLLRRRPEDRLVAEADRRRVLADPRLHVPRGRSVRDARTSPRRGSSRSSTRTTRAALLRRRSRRVGQTIEADGQRFRVVGVVEDVSELRDGALRRHLGAATRRPRPTPTRASSWAASTPSRWRDDRPRCRRSTRSSTRGCCASSCPIRRTTRRSSRRSRPSSRRFARLMPTGDRKDPESQVWKLVGLLAGARPAVRADSDGEPRQHQHQPDHGARLGDRRAQGVRRPGAHAGRPVPGREHPADARRRRCSGSCCRSSSLRALTRAASFSYAQFTLNLRVFAYGMALALRVRPDLRRLPGLADVAAQPGRRAEGRRLAMTRHLLRLIWNRKRQNFLLTRRDLLLVPDAVRRRALRRALRQQLRGSRSASTSIGVWSIRVDRKEPDEDPAVKARHRETYRQLLMALREMPEVEGRRGGVHRPVRQLELGQRHAAGRRPRGRLRRQQRHRRLPRRCCSIPLVAGRWFSREDDAATWTPVVINQRLAQRDLRRRPIRSGRSSRRSAIPNEPPPDPDEKPEVKRVVGVIDEFRQHGELSTPEQLPVPPHAARRRRSQGVAAASASSCALRPGTTAAFEETLVKRRDGGGRDWSFEVAAARHHARRQAAAVHRCRSTSSAPSPAFLLLMVALGLTGVVWQSVTQRIREFGLRRAKGATIANVRTQVLGRDGDHDLDRAARRRAAARAAAAAAAAARPARRAGRRVRRQHCAFPWPPSIF